MNLATRGRPETGEMAKTGMDLIDTQTGSRESGTRLGAAAETTQF
jgi:hypothetical protein